MTLDLLSHMTLPASPADLSTYPYGLAALDTPLGGRKGPAKQAELAPFAPAEASIFPRFVGSAPAVSRSASLTRTPTRAAVLPRHQFPHLALRLPLPPPAPPPFERLFAPDSARDSAPKGAALARQLGRHVAQCVLRRRPARARCCRPPPRRRCGRRTCRCRVVGQGEARRSQGAVDAVVM